MATTPRGKTGAGRTNTRAKKSATIDLDAKDIKDNSAKSVKKPTPVPAAKANTSSVLPTKSAKTTQTKPAPGQIINNAKCVQIRWTGQILASCC